jgi:hypothetical protein
MGIGRRRLHPSYGKVINDVGWVESFGVLRINSAIPMVFSHGNKEPHTQLLS